MEKTIYALCTPPLNGALHVIRLCGPASFAITSAICKNQVQRKGDALQHNYIVDGTKIIDEVVLAKFLAPRSFTGEDTVEISCHGGMAVVGAIVTLLESQGATQAQRGEFTKTALLNGKLDLVQAEAVDAIVRAPSKEAVTTAGKALYGDTSKLIADFKSRLLDVMAKIEVSIDYPEYDEASGADAKKILAELRVLVKEAHGLVKKSQRTIKAFDGLAVAIVGAPNAGKSSLFNALLGQNRSIVTEVAGTTRDFIEADALVDGIPVRFIDTAGIRKSKGRIEALGIEKSVERTRHADLILVLLDGSKEFVAAKNKFLEEIPVKKRIIVKTKGDLLQKCGYPGLTVSSKTGNLKELYSALHGYFAKTVALDGGERLLTERQIGLMSFAADKIEQASLSLKNGATVDLAAQPLAEAVQALRSILGEEYADDLLDTLFARFCLGK